MSKANNDRLLSSASHICQRHEDSIPLTAALKHFKKNKFFSLSESRRGTAAHFRSRENSRLFGISLKLCSVLRTLRLGEHVDERVPDMYAPDCRRGKFCTVFILTLYRIHIWVHSDSVDTLIRIQRLIRFSRCEESVQFCVISFSTAVNFIR